MKRRVLMLTHQCAGRGGSYMRAVSLARPLVGMGYEITLLASRADSGVRLRCSDWHGVRVIEMPDVLPWRLRNAGLSPMDLVGRLLYCRDGFDLFHTFDHRPCASLPALWSRRPAVPWISDWADLWGTGGLSIYRTGLFAALLARLDAWMEPAIRTRCDAVTAISRHLRERAIGLGLDSECVRLLPAGANADLIVPGDKAEMRGRYGVPQDAPVLACSGFSTVDAGLMARVFLELREIRPDVLLLMTGGRIPTFDAAIRQAEAERSVLHLGVLPYEKLGEALACGDVMWQPYGDAPVDVARFPNRFGEYIAAGRPIATNPGGDHAVIVEAEGIGIVTPVEPRATAQGIAALLDDAARCAHMGARARELAVTRFSWKTIAAQAAQLYEELLGG